MTLLDFMKKNELDPFSDDDILEAAKLLKMIYYDDIPEPIMENLMTKFVSHYMFNEIGFRSMEEFQLRLRAYMRDKEPWYKAMYNNYKDLLPDEMWEKSVVVTGDESTEGESDKTQTTTSTGMTQSDTEFDTSRVNSGSSNSSSIESGDNSTEVQSITMDKNTTKRDTNTNQSGAKGVFGYELSDSESTVERDANNTSDTKSKSCSKDDGWDHSNTEDISKTEGPVIVTNNNDSKVVKGFGSFESSDEPGAFPDESGILAEGTTFTKSKDTNTTNDNSVKTVESDKHSSFDHNKKTKSEDFTRTIVDEEDKTESYSDKAHGSNELNASDETSHTDENSDGTSVNIDFNDGKHSTTSTNETTSEDEVVGNDTTHHVSTNESEGSSVESGTHTGTKTMNQTTVTKGMDAWRPELARKFYDMYIGVDAEFIKDARKLFLLIY